MQCRLQSSVADVENSKEENTADYNAKMRSLINAIEMVFGSAAALSATFGYDDRVGLNVDLLYEMQKKTLEICDEKYVVLLTQQKIVFLLTQTAVEATCLQIYDSSVLSCVDMSTIQVKGI